VAKYSDWYLKGAMYQSKRWVKPLPNYLEISTIGFLTNKKFEKANI